MLLVMAMLAPMVPNNVFAESLRSKSVVLVVFNNQSGKRYNKSLNEIAEGELSKKVEGLYYEVDADEYRPIFNKKSFVDESTDEICEYVQNSGARYFVYTELLPYSGKEDYNLLYHRKEMTATAVLRIFDLETRKELFNKKYSMSAKDSTDYFFIGNPSMAKKALRNLMFRVGEAVSVNLPL